MGEQGNKKEYQNPRNKFAESIVAHFYRRSTLDVMIFTYIDVYRQLLPSAGITECAEAFMKRHKISEDLLTLDTIRTSYYRTLQLYNDAQRKEPK